MALWPTLNDGGVQMTVGSKLQQTLASAEGVKANLKSFSLDTQDQQAKQMYEQLAQSMTNIVNTLQARVNYVEQQEPQYKQQ
jgi:hypothetical protein